MTGTLSRTGWRPGKIARRDLALFVAVLLDLQRHAAVHLFSAVLDVRSEATE